MSVKRFVAADMRRALELVRVEMGEEAIILSSKRVKGGVEVLTSNDAYYQNVAKPEPVITQAASAPQLQNFKRAVTGFSAEDEYFDVDFPMSSDVAWGQESIMGKLMAKQSAEEAETKHKPSPTRDTRSNSRPALRQFAEEHMHDDSTIEDFIAENSVINFRQAMREQFSGQQFAEPQYSDERSAEQVIIKKPLPDRTIAAKSSKQSVAGSTKEREMLTNAQQRLQQTRQLAESRSVTDSHYAINRYSENVDAAMPPAKKLSPGAAYQPQVKYSQSIKPVEVKGQVQPVMAEQANAKRQQNFSSLHGSNTQNSEMFSTGNNEEGWLTQTEYFADGANESVYNRSALQQQSNLQSFEFRQSMPSSDAYPAPVSSAPPQYESEQTDAPVAIEPSVKTAEAEEQNQKPDNKNVAPETANDGADVENSEELTTSLAENELLANQPAQELSVCGEKISAASVSSALLSLGSFHYEPGDGKISFQLDPSAYATPVSNHSNRDKTESANSAFLDDLFDEQFSELKTEILDMRELLQTQLSALAKKSEQEAEEKKARIVGNTVKTTIKRRLHQLGLPEAEIDKCLTTFKPEKNLSMAWSESLAALSHRVPVIGNDVVDKGGFFAFVGPGGAGKTATVAKLASRYVLKHGAKGVALVTTEGQQIAGNQQLQRLASILNIEIHQTSEANSLEFILQDLCDYKLVLVDIAGARSDDKKLRSQLVNLRRLPQLKSFLVLSANTQIQTLKTAMSDYKIANPAGCILTKLDDTASLGEVLAVVVKANLPVAYTSSGPAMPEEIQVARAHHLVTKAVTLLKAGSQRILKRNQQIRSKATEINRKVTYQTASAK